MNLIIAVIAVFVIYKIVVFVMKFMNEVDEEVRKEEGSAGRRSGAVHGRVGQPHEPEDITDCCSFCKYFISGTKECALHRFSIGENENSWICGDYTENKELVDFFYSPFREKSE